MGALLAFCRFHLPVSVALPVVTDPRIVGELASDLDHLFYLLVSLLQHVCIKESHVAALSALKQLRELCTSLNLWRLFNLIPLVLILAEWAFQKGVLSLSHARVLFDIDFLRYFYPIYDCLQGQIFCSFIIVIILALQRERRYTLREEVESEGIVEHNQVLVDNLNHVHSRLPQR